MSDDIEFDDPEAETEALRSPDPRDASAIAEADDSTASGVTDSDDVAAIEQDPARHADADERVDGLPDEWSPADERSPADHVAAGDWATEPE